MRMKPGESKILFWKSNYQAHELIINYLDQPKWENCWKAPLADQVLLCLQYRQEAKAQRGKPSPLPLLFGHRDRTETQARPLSTPRLNFIPSPVLCERKAPKMTDAFLPGRTAWDIKVLTTRHCSPAHPDSFSHLPAGDCKKLCSHLAGPLAISVGYHCLSSSIKIDSKLELLQISVHRSGLQKHSGDAGFAVTSQRPTVAKYAFYCHDTGAFYMSREKNLVLLM